MVLSLFASLVIFGCSDVGTNVNEPATLNSEHQLISLPANSNLSTEGSNSATGIFDKNNGGSLTINDSYTTHSGKTVTVSAELNIPAGAFDNNTQQITMTANEDYTSLTFDPHIVFNKPLSLTVTFSGLDLRSMIHLLTHLGFYYISDDGRLTPVENDGISINIFTGTISVRNAKIHHFSRYAFVT